GVIVGPLRDMAVAHPELVGRHLGSVVDPWLDRVAALNAAWWSGGTLVHVPAGVEVEVPIQATSDRRAATTGRFERTLVVAEEDSAVHLLQGCSAPVYSADPLRCTVVEVVVGAGASVTHTSVQNWSTNVTNLAIKRAVVGAAGRMEWIDGNMGAGRTVTQPGIVLAGPEATGFVRSAAAAGPGQRQQVGARIVHRAPQTTAAVEARLIVANGGRCHHHGQITVGSSAAAARSSVHSAAMLVDRSASVGAEVDRRLARSDAVIEETAAAAGLDDSARVYLASRGLTGDQADALLLNGFLAPISRHLPLEYAVEWHRLVENRVGASVG
ncbi:MAG: SufD family Fe-S cluster assembly protein, partial [Actinomycetota bacterium]